MLITPRFIFIEMPRTGSTHVVRLFQALIGGERRGMHERPDQELRKGPRAVLATIRNPWDWYISQWTIGCGRTGILHVRATRPAETVRCGPNKGQRFDPGPWHHAYADETACDVGRFRAWLQLLMDPTVMALTLPGHFGSTDLRTHSGYYSFRVADLFGGGSRPLHQQIGLCDQTALLEYLKADGYVTHFAHTERLAEELLEALDAIGEPLSLEARRTIREAPASNRSHRLLPTEAYYDEASFRLVEKRDGLIAQHFGYRASAPHKFDLEAGRIVGGWYPPQISW